MAKRKPDTGAIYISPRLRASLEPVGRCALTVVTAPMGYGKTTAVNWFLGTQPPGCAIRISIYSDSLPALWQSGRQAFRDAGLTALEGFECPGDPASAGLLADTLCRELRRPEPWYLFADDLHLLPDPRMARFLCELAARLPENVHLIAASRDRILSGEQVLRLGGRLHRIGAEQLRLEGGELAAYVHRCGAALDQELRVRHIAVKDKAEERAKALTAEKLKAETERDRALAQSRSLAAERDQVINQLQAQIDGEEHRIGFAVSRAMEKRDKTIRLLQNALKVSSYILKQFADMLYKASEVFKRAVDAIIHFGTDKYKSVFAPQEAADIKSVMQEYGETTEQKKAVGEWLCYYAESNKPFDTIKHRHTLKEVGDVAEGKYDWKIDRQINGSIKL